jgi:phosphatidylinositol alpha-mannosyltransferase
MAAGKAIVSSAVDGCAEVLEHGRTALLVPPKDKDALAAAIGTLLADPDRRRALSEAARAASRAYDIATCVARMQDLYDEVLAADGARRPGGA